MLQDPGRGHKTSMSGAAMSTALADHAACGSTASACPAPPHRAAYDDTCSKRVLASSNAKSCNPTAGWSVLCCAEHCGTRTAARPATLLRQQPCPTPLPVLQPTFGRTSHCCSPKPRLASSKLPPNSTTESLWTYTGAARARAASHGIRGLQHVTGRAHAASTYAAACTALHMCGMHGGHIHCKCASSHEGPVVSDASVCACMSCTKAV